MIGFPRLTYWRELPAHSRPSCLVRFEYKNVASQITETLSESLT